MSSLRLVVAAVLVAAALSACGGSSSLSASAYRQKANALCTANNKVLNTPGKKGEGEKAVIQNQERSTESTVKKIEALKPPGSLKAKVKAWTTLLDREVATNVKSTNLLFAGQVKQAEALVSASKPVVTQMHANARAVGVTACGG